MLKEKIKNIYEKHYKILLGLTFLMLVLAIGQIAYQYTTTGDFVNKGISLKGGSTITFSYENPQNIFSLENALKAEFPGADIGIRTISSAGTVTSYALDSNIQENKKIDALILALKEKAQLQPEDYSVEIVDSSLGASFFMQTAFALGAAFLLMAIVVFIYFRLAIPSLAVILSAFSDIVTTLAVFNLTGIKLSTAGVAAFLMLVGYSVDTDMLLSARVLKRQEGTIMEKVYGAIKTGMVMTTTTLVAVVVALIFVHNEVVKQIMIILFIGIIVDILNTWIQNVGILRWYVEKKK